MRVYDNKGRLIVDFKAHASKHASGADDEVLLAASQVTPMSKVKESSLNADLPACRVRFTMRGRYTGKTYYGRIYKNGSAIGTLRSFTASVDNETKTYSEDFAGFVTNDLIQVYTYMQSGGIEVGIKNFRFYYDEGITHISGDELDSPLAMATVISVTNQDP